jgi:hypothetical protein
VIDLELVKILKQIEMSTFKKKGLNVNEMLDSLDSDI